ncbi:hypothetical protein H2201_007702 [Coniosporium apollinis]|uniref:Conserved oligomeric Golgi complex subunit 8 n=1 Tax=Coniosporium apollinis TaxID=61459 RepID=A0ABQ9NI57_9PEZI|nr:hypothetical protein H2201_007702 [Coniosporium apollinis]
MADPLFELLVPYFETQDAVAARPIPSPSDPVTTSYLNRLTTLSLSALSSSEPQSLLHSSQSVLRSLQALSKRSYKSIIASSDQLSSLNTTLPTLASQVSELQDALPSLENSAASFAQKYSRTADDPILDRRRKAMLLARNVDRVSDVLDLPTLLSSAIPSSTGSAQASTTASLSSANASYASALDLHAHIKRLQALYPNLDLIKDISAQAEQEMKSMTTNLITSLQGQGIKLAGAMRTIGWLRRVAPELDSTYTSQKSANFGSSEGALGALFLVCRLANLLNMLEALEPLRELADQETARRVSGDGRNDAKDWAGGQQTERYLKRYIEIFREQSFAIISTFQSIFPAALPTPGAGTVGDELGAKMKSPTLDSRRGRNGGDADDTLQPLPSALATFPLHLVELLFETLKHYLPNVKDRTARDSLLTQVLYCAGSLGRLGGDFGMMLALLDEEDESEEESEDVSEWVDAFKKHRVQASRLELLASGVGAGRSSSLPLRETSPASSAG